MKRPTGLADEPEERKRVWARVFKELGVQHFLYIREFIWDAIAHELAEKIRNERDAADVPGSPFTSHMAHGAAWAADLIDPEKED